MKRWLAKLGAEYGYTSRQSFQLLGLLVTGLIFLVIPLLYKAWLLQQPMPELPEPSLIGVSDTTLSEYPSYKAYSGKQESVVIALHPFDPNAIDADEWQTLGAPRWLAERIIKYRDKGGSFKSVEDIGKIYNFPPALLAQIAPYVRLKTTDRYFSKSNLYEDNYAGDAPSYPIINLNTADSAELEALPQLGPATARNIVKYRSLLGGFVRKEQLYELYNQDSARTAIFLPYLKLYPGEGKTLLDINELARKGKLYHPYLPKANARLITAYIRQHGSLAKPELLLENKLLDSINYNRLLPYLSF